MSCSRIYVLFYFGFYLFFDPFIYSKQHKRKKLSLIHSSHHQSIQLNQFSHLFLFIVLLILVCRCLNHVIAPSRIVQLNLSRNSIFFLNFFYVNEYSMSNSLRTLIIQSSITSLSSGGDCVWLSLNRRQEIGHWKFYLFTLCYGSYVD